MPIKRRKPGQSSGRRVRRGFGTQALATAAGRVGAYAIRGVAKRVGRFARRRFAGPAKGSANKPRMAGKQYARSKIKSGRRLPKRRLGDTLVDQSMVSNVWYYKSLDGDFDGDQGRNVLSKVQATAGSTVWYPLYLYNLTAIQQGGDPVHPFYRLYGTSTGSCRWVKRSGQDENGSANQALQARTVGGTPTQMPIQEKSFLDWARMRFTFYGAKNRPMQVRLRLVRFKDECMQPENCTTSAMVPATEEYQKNSAWYTYMKSLVSHPIAGGSCPVLNKMMTIVASKTFNFQPSNTTDSDPDPEHKTVDWFRRVSARLDYKGQAQNMVHLNNTGVNDGLQTAVDVGSAYYIGTRPANVKHNLYIMIDCNSYGAVPTVVGATGDAGGPDVASTDAASFDMNIEVCHKSLDTI